jgi:hypothetical protein
MLAGMPSVGFAIEGARREGFRAVQVWDEYLDRTADPTAWAVDRATAAVEFAGGCALLIAKSLTTRAAGLAADRAWPAVWLTPLLNDGASVQMLRRRTAPALLVGGPDDPMWNSDLAREISPDVLELPGADHGLARIEDLRAVADAVAGFVAKLAGPLS